MDESQRSSYFHSFLSLDITGVSAQHLFDGYWLWTM